MMKNMSFYTQNVQKIGYDPAQKKKCTKDRVRPRSENSFMMKHMSFYTQNVQKIGHDPAQINPAQIMESNNFNLDYMDFL